MTEIEKLKKNCQRNKRECLEGEDFRRLDGVEEEEEEEEGIIYSLR